MPLVMSKDEWSRIMGWTDLGRENPETVRKREYIRYLADTSAAMTKSWPNSLENVNKRNEELRRARIEAAEQANTNFYKQYVKRKREEQQRLLQDARDVYFKNKDSPKMFLRAVIETVTQKEREEQIKFMTELRRQEAERKDQDDKDIMRKAKEWNELMETRKKRRFDANKQYQKEILDQAHEVSERNRREYETELNLQKLDNMKADEEMAAIKKFEKEFKEAERARIYADAKRSKEEADARRNERAARDLMDERLLEVLRRSKARTDRKRKQTEKDVQDEKLRVLNAISSRLESGDAAREERERQALEKAMKEREDKAEAQRQARIERQQKLKEERLEIHRQFLKSEEQRLHHLHTMRSWDLVNRFKNEEIYHDFLDKLRQEKKRKTNEYREDLLKLWKERDERDARELAEKRYFYGEYAEQLMRQAELNTLAHGAALLQEAAAHERPPYALHRAIDRYCKQRRLYPLPELPLPLQKHFPQYAPTDRSQRCERLRMAGFTCEEEPDKHDSGTDNKLERVETKPEPAYARRGPANGLQRSSKEDLTLPAITLGSANAGK
ncbi:trichohyalin-like [Battus philenor]|uniref:trichohyalin-like n=1 Tax=Battus philenor TaxID=42288 RepID=UPI0035D0B0CE